MSAEVQTKFVIVGAFVAKRRLIGGIRMIRVPEVFIGKGFREIRLEAKIGENKRWAGDIISVFENLKETTPFEISKGSVPGNKPQINEPQKIQGVENLAQVLQTLKAAGTDTITVKVAKPRFSSGSSRWGPSAQRISITAQAKDVLFAAGHVVEFPKKIQEQEKLLFGVPTLKQRFVRWLLK